jgi:hypothetical protein
MRRPLGAEDLELLAISACLIGRSDDSRRTLDRAHHVYLDAGEAIGAARCAFWRGLGLVVVGGEMAHTANACVSRI